MQSLPPLGPIQMKIMNLLLMCLVFRLFSLAFALLKEIKLQIPKITKRAPFSTFMTPATPVPWFAPSLSSAISRAVLNLGRSSVLQKGDEIVSSVFFKRLVFVKRGFLAQSLINPRSNTPFMLTLSGPMSFGSTAGVSMRLDQLPRRYWAVTPCEIYTMIPEILLRLADVEKSWSTELSSYVLRRAACERLGFMICQMMGYEQRLGCFLLSALIASGVDFVRESKKKAPFIALPLLPSRKLIASVTSCPVEAHNETLRKWARDAVLQHKDGKLWMSSGALSEYWEQLEPFLLMQEQVEMALKPAESPAEELKKFG